MPFAVAGTIGLGLFNAGLYGLASAVVSLAGTAVIGVGLSIGLSLAARALLRSPPSDGQLEVRQSVPARLWHYGGVKVSGALAFYEEDGASDENVLWKVVLLSSREIDGIEAYYLNDLEMTLDTNSVVVSDPYVSFNVRLFVHLGTDDQTVDADLTAAFPSLWTTDHRLRGIAYIVGAFPCPAEPSTFQNIYPQGEPQISLLIRGAKVYDPRLDSTVEGGSGSHRHDDKSTWAWSENPALCILDYLTHSDGYAHPISRMDLASFMAMADLCEEQVTSPDGDEDRYRIAATVNLAESRKTVLEGLLAACDGRLVPSADGKVALHGGTWEEPTVTLTADDIIEASFAPPDGVERYNELAVQYLSEAAGWKEDEADPVRDQADYDLTGELRTQPFDATHVPSANQARRLAKIKLARDNPERLVNLRTKLGGLNAIGEIVVTLQWPELDIDGPFWVERIGRLDDGTGAQIALRSASEAAYSWTSEDFPA